MSDANFGDGSGKKRGRPPLSNTSKMLRKGRVTRTAMLNPWSTVGVSVNRIKAKCLAELTEEEIESITPREMFKLVAMEALRTQNANIVLQVAIAWAPYELPKLMATQINAEKKRDVSDYSDEELFALAGPDMGDEGDIEEAEGEGEIPPVR